MREEERESEAAVVDLVTGWRADWDNGLEQLYSSIGAPESVGGFTYELAVLILLNGHGPQYGVDMLVVVDEVSDPVVLVGGERVGQPLRDQLPGQLPRWSAQRRGLVRSEGRRLACRSH